MIQGIRSAGRAFGNQFATTPWLVPMIYTVTSIIVGYALPRLEHHYFPDYSHEMSPGSALAFFSTIGAGMMALTGIVFAIAFVVVQFSSLAYSPRLIVIQSNNRLQLHALGIFFATFIYSVVTLSWIDRAGSGSVPYISSMVVIALLVASMIAFTLLIQSVNDLQIQNVLRTIGGKGRTVIEEMFPRPADDTQPDDLTPVPVSAPLTQTIHYSGEPLVIASFDLPTLLALANAANAVIAIECGVGETLVEGATLFQIYGAGRSLPERDLMRAVRLSVRRTFEQDPKYPIRLLVDVAIKALSPAINDPTTAVQALDQIEDLLRRLGSRQLDAGYATDPQGTLRVTFPVPTWQDYLALSFDEIRQFGAGSIQVVRRLRAALSGLQDALSISSRRQSVSAYLNQLNLAVERSAFDDTDKVNAREEDRQGLGLSRKRKNPTKPSAETG